MRKCLFHNYFVFALFLGIFAPGIVNAQTDVTDTYLTNAGFDADAVYVTGGTETIATADPGNLWTVTGWEATSAPSWSAGGTFEFGWAGTFNSISTPESGYNGETGTGEGVMGLTAGWGGTITYKQDLTLPIGKYALVVAETLRGITSINSNQTGWVPSTGSSAFSTFTSVENLGDWSADTIIFKVYEETSGYVQIGMQAFNSSSTANGRLFVDFVKIIDFGADKTDLTALVDSASVMVANPETVVAESSAYADLATAISGAQVIIANESATAVEVLGAESTVLAAITNVYAAIYAYELRGELTTLKDSVDVPASFDKSVVETLIATPLTVETQDDYIAALETAISELKDIISQNVDASLADLMVDGKTIRDFDADTLDYLFNIYSAVVEVPAVPTITVTANSTYSAEPVITPAAEVPGTTSITVTAGNGDQITYTVHFEFVQLIGEENYTATVESFQDQAVELSGKGQLTITGSDEVLKGSAINIVSTDAWIYFSSMKPSEVISYALPYITVNGDLAEYGVNVHVAQYLNGAMLLPHSPEYAALTVYTDESLGGTSMDFVASKHYASAELGSMEDDVESFVLRKGYMATFASNTDGTGKSRVYIADKYDVTINVMPEGLQNTTSLIVVRPWRWTVKKSVRGSKSDAILFNAGSQYDYNNSDYSSVDLEYVPMRHNPGWNAYSNFYDKYSSTHALGFNEPDNSVDDGYSTVEEAIAQWPSMMESGLRLGSPCVTDGGLSWLAEFMAEAEALDYRVDFIAWHFYRAGYTAQGYYDALKSIYDTYHRPIWITEFNNGCNWTYDGNVPTVETNGAVIESFIEMLDTTSFIERYMVWDGCNEELRMTNSSTGELYPAGEAYQALESTMSYTEDYYNDQDIVTIQENGTGFCGVDGTIEGGFAKATASEGSGIDYKVIFKSVGYKTMYVTYAAEQEFTANILVNDSVYAKDVVFPSTGSLDYTDLVALSLNTGTGIADLRIEAATAAGLPAIDYIQLTESTPASCSLTQDSYPVILSYTAQQTGNEASHILDGSTGTRWSAEGYPQSAVIDYGEVLSITGTRVRTYSSRAYQFTVELDTTPDFTNPYIVDRSSNTSASQPISNNFAAVKARYARLTVTGANSSSYSGLWASITMFQLIEEEPLAIGDATFSSNDVSIYPNPATDQFSVSLSETVDNAMVYIYSTNGQLVKQLAVTANTNVVSSDDMAAGMYTVKVVSNNAVVTRKLIIE